MNYHLKNNRNGFSWGITKITNLNDENNPTKIELSVLKKQADEVYQEETQLEKAFLLMSGNVVVEIDNQEKVTFQRSSLFDESASCFHVPANTKVKITFLTDSELTIYGVLNEKKFPAEIYYPTNVVNEHRGKGQVGDTCYRFVRTIFDDRNSHKNAELVLGEVVNMPGKWSSYPPHHHPQPEIYHYRFTLPQGYGHGELGEDVLKIKQNDTVLILDEVDHAQCSAPGYGMYYSWVIRHLENNRYTVPEFTKEHDWTQKPEANFWQSKEIQR